MKLPSHAKEPSTWAGLGVLLAVFGVPTSLTEAIVTAAAAAAGLLAVFLHDPKEPPK